MTTGSTLSVAPTRRLFRGALMALALLPLGGCLGMGATGVTRAPELQARPMLVYVASTRPPLRDTPALNPSRENARFYRQIVTVPPGHVAGTISRPQMTPESPARHFTMPYRVALEPDTFIHELTQAVGRRTQGERDVMVYVHGFNTSYEDAAFRLVQVATDSGFRGTPVLFTWASYRRVLAYSGDREVATASRDAFDRLLIDLGRMPGIGRIHIIAHSMGAFLTMEGLRQAGIAGRGDLGGRLGEVILAAPDLDVDVFRAQVSRVGAPERISLFVQSDDVALQAASRVAFDRQRVGSLDIRNARHREIMSTLGVRVFTMTNRGWTDLIRHDTFAEAPEIVRLIGAKIATPERVAEARAPAAVAADPEVARPDILAPEAENP